MRVNNTVNVGTALAWAWTSISNIVTPKLALFNSLDQFSSRVMDEAVFNANQCLFLRLYKL